MKKIIVMTACMLFMSSMAFAATSITMDLTDNSTTGKTVYADDTTASASTEVIGKTSTGVGVGLLTNSNGYSMVTQHIKGSKAFGTSYDSTSIFSETVTTEGSPLKDVPSDTTTADFTSWEEM